MRDEAEDCDLFGHGHSPLAQAGDAVWTPDWVAIDIVRHFKPSGRILDPCRGAGAFTRALPPDAEWCEITEGRDFFDWRTPVDWVISNPPYSLARQFLRHSLVVTDNVVYLMPPRNVFSGHGFIRECAGWGGMAAIRWYGTGTSLGFPMGNGVAAIHWRRGHQGTIAETFYEDEKRAAISAGKIIE